MTEVYTNALKWGNKILYRGRKNGEPIQARVAFKPTLFVKNSKTSETDFKGLYGEAVSPVHFDDIKSAMEFVDRYKGVDSFTIYGNTDYAQQFLYQNHKDVHGDIKSIKVLTIDIETTANEGFPDPKNPVESVLLITIRDFNTKETVTYGVGDIDFDCNRYVQCSSEFELLSRFINDFAIDHPDIITGWNSNLFDLPYLYMRTIRVGGEDMANRLSPWGTVRVKELDLNGRLLIKLDINGISCIDYLDIYKKFILKPRESYKLDFIAQVELGEEKLNYDEYESFTEFWQKDWSKFVRYNIHDVNLVDKLEDKLRLIDLLVVIAYDAKCNFDSVFSPVKTWDCILSNQMLEMNIVAPIKGETKSFGSIEGAYVQEPVPGMYNWVVSFDATSLYPSIIMQYNISPETLLPQQLDCTVEGMLNGDYEFKESSCSILANGAMFSNQSKGIFPIVVEKMFDDRQKYKKMMLKCKQDLELESDPRKIHALENQIANLDNKQHSRKILLNSLYGATANEGFRFYERKISEGITMTGQFIIRYVSQYVNQFLNKSLKTDSVNYAFYMDTDSCYITLGSMVDRFFKNKSTEKIVDLLDRFCVEKLSGVFDSACYDLTKYTNAFAQRVYFKREAIASIGVWTGKKRYALSVYDNEGVRYSEPELKIMGLEIVRSSTPEPVRKMLKECVRLILQGSEDAVQDYLAKCKTTFFSSPAESIAFPRGVNGVERYRPKDGRWVPSTPIAVRGAWVYNMAVKRQGLEHKYQMIGEGDKIKFLYLREPNPIGDYVISFTGKIPTEFDLTGFVDYHKMWDTAFFKPINKILLAIGWSAQKQAQLQGFQYD